MDKLTDSAEHIIVDTEKADKLAEKIADYVYRKSENIEHGPETYKEFQILISYAMHLYICEMLGVEVKE